MHEAAQPGFAACVAGKAIGGSITIGKITTPVTQPVNVQFGFAFSPPSPSTGYPLPTYPPLAGTSAILSTKADLIPGSLTTILGCPSSNATVQNICQQAAANPADNQVYALAQQAGELQNFNLLSWTQPVKFQLINPLLGGNCYIGTDGDPVVLHPQLGLGPGAMLTIEHDPVPAAHPNAFVLGLTGALATDTTFSAPGVIGCGPGGLANVAVDEALDAGSGLPAASGNSLTLNGSFLIAADETFSAPPSVEYANELLAAFKASTNGEHSVKHPINMSQAKSMFGHGG
jgi:hypothetical protein